MVLDAFASLATGFEGCEKKLEIDFSITQDSPTDLRDITRQEIDDILQLARCSIISIQNNRDFDAYVLSESSLFIYPAKLLIKTCGTTSLLKCVKALLAAAERVGAKPDFLQFSRSNFLFPSMQHFPHRAFHEETDYLNEQLGIAGDAFILGSLNGARWHLYIWDFNLVAAKEYQQQTLEVVMFNLDTTAMNTFYNRQSSISALNTDRKDAHSAVQQTQQEEKHSPSPAVFGSPCSSGEEATVVSGISALLPGSRIDSHLFTPCGYSCNGCFDPSTEEKSSVSVPRNEQHLLGKQGSVHQAYFTIHVTPEAQCSFVSFETNAVLHNYTALVRSVVRLFQPSSFCVSLFVDSGSLVSDSRRGMEWEHEGFITKSTTHHAFEAGYNATVSVHYKQQTR